VGWISARWFAWCGPPGSRVALTIARTNRPQFDVPTPARSSGSSFRNRR
jgi:hypothetical protein